MTTYFDPVYFNEEFDLYHASSGSSGVVFTGCCDSILSTVPNDCWAECAGCKFCPPDCCTCVDHYFNVSCSGGCCCSELADTLYAEISHWIFVLGGGPELRTDFFTFTNVTDVDDCACGFIFGNTIDGTINCGRKFWHGSYLCNYPVWTSGGTILVECPTHIVMLCGTSENGLLFIFGIDKYFGADCEYHAAPGNCEECISLTHPCPVAGIHMGPGTDCGDIYEIWIQDTPFTSLLSQKNSLVAAPSERKCPYGWYVFSCIPSMPFDPLKPTGKWMAMPNTWSCKCNVGNNLCSAREPNITATQYLINGGNAYDFVFVRCGYPWDILSVTTPPPCS